MSYTHAEASAIIAETERHLATAPRADFVPHVVASATTDAKFWEQIQADRRARGLPPLTASDVAGSVHTPAATTRPATRHTPPAAGSEATGLARVVNAFSRQSGLPPLSKEEFARISG